MTELIDYREDNRWTVYVHIVSKEISGYDWDKYYVGITSVKPEDRWGKNGIKYYKQGFYNAIIKYGWDNIEHDIVAENLTEEEACNMEVILIKELDANGIHGYNNTSGGRYQYQQFDNLVGKVFDEVKVLDLVDIIEKAGNNIVYYYLCECSCGEEVILTNFQLKYSMEVVSCKKCKDERIHKKKVDNYASKNQFEIIDNYVLVHTLKQDVIICDASDIDILKKYTISMEYKKGKPSRVRCYNTELWDKSFLNLEKILYNWDDYIIYKNGNHFDYRKENLYFVDCSTFTTYHHLIQNIDNDKYLIRASKRKDGNAYVLDPKLYIGLELSNIRKSSRNLEEIINERNKLLHIKYKNNDPIQKVLDRYFIVK